MPRHKERSVRPLPNLPKNITEHSSARRLETRKYDFKQKIDNIRTAYIKHCARQISKEKTITTLQSNSAAYQSEIINYCEQHGIQFPIGADLDQAVVDAIRAIPVASRSRGVSTLHGE